MLVSSVLDEINSSTSIYQRGFLRVMAVAQTHGLDIAQVALSFSETAPSGQASAINQVSSLLDSGTPLVDALEQCPTALPNSVMEALKVADQHQVLDHVFQQLVESHQVTAAANHSDHANDVKAIDLLSRLAGKTVFVLSITTFIMLYIVPQFSEMFDEFGVEFPASMQYAIAFANLFTTYWFLFPMVLAVLFYVMAIRSPHFLARYFLRWMPGQWNSPVFPKKIKQKMSLAWKLLNSPQEKTGDEPSRGMDHVSLAGKRESRVIATASSKDSAAWLLRKMAIGKHTSSQKSGYFVLRLFSTFVIGVLILYGFLLAVGVFQSLISLIQEM